MKKEHTPGPWEVTRRPGRMYVSDANGYNVMAGLSTSPLTEGDLFNGAAMEKASAAIAKATGGA